MFFILVFILCFLKWLKPGALVSVPQKKTLWQDWVWGFDRLTEEAQVRKWGKWVREGRDASNWVSKWVGLFCEQISA